MNKLRLDDLAVESFDTTATKRKQKGTVFGEQCTCYTVCTCPGCPTCAATCAQTCDDQTCPACPSCADTCAYTCDDNTCLNSCEGSCAGPTCVTRCVGTCLCY
ncbi:MAG TPA: hypothetical protein VF006_23660 [Longimicrobium sp.]